jgi:ADP-ribose pyrophosphatase YjhB (NUDIX family)
MVGAAGDWGHDGVWAVPALRLPMIITDEVAELSSRYGTPIQRTFNVQADDYIYSYRFNKVIDRRAEVVFAIEDCAGQVWVHAKSHYPAHIFRLPSGGVHWDELVVEGLLREVDEETHLPVEIVRFLGMIEYRFWHGDLMAPFVSYVFHLRTGSKQPLIQESEQISDFRAVLPSQIGQMALDLRSMIGDRRAWGQWRALAHDLVYDTLLS